ncbi:MAG TPA: hypothetical protein ENN63_13060 [Bacteroidetes bacterium]|nr:hypothetical protein [Bacteroidota bacterium]
MRKGLIITLGWLFCIFSWPDVLKAQLGNPFIAQPKLPPDITPENYSIIQDPDGVMLFANRQGTLSYNGIEWKYLDLPVVPSVLYLEPENRQVYLGSASSYGRLARTGNQPYRYEELSGDFSEIGHIVEIQSNTTHIYFMSSETLSEISLEDPGHKKIWRAAPGQVFDGLLVHSNGFLLHIRHQGFFHTRSDSLVRFPDEYGFDSTSPAAVFPSSHNEWTLCTRENQIYFFDGENFRLFKPEDQDYLSSNIISCGLSLPGKQMVIGTYTGGCMIIDRNTGETNYLFNYRNGLPEDEILAMGTDRNQGLWLAQEVGLSRVDFSFPVRNFNIYPGLEGNLHTSLHTGKDLYVGTSEGVFYLNEIREYKEVEVWVRAEDRQPQQVPVAEESAGKDTVRKDEPAGEKESVSETKEKKGFFRWLFGKKNKEEEEKEESESEVKAQEESSEETIEPVAVEPAPVRPRYVRRKISTLESVRYEFTRVTGLHAKCRQLIQMGNRLLAATNIGVFEINDQTASPVIENMNIRYITPSCRENVFYAAGSAGILVLNREPGGWKKELWAADLGETASILEEDAQTLWAGETNRVFRIKVNNRLQPVEISEYTLPMVRPYRVMARAISHEPFFFVGTSIFTYNREADALEPAIGKFPEFTSTPQLICNHYRITWLRSEQNWEVLNSPETIDPRLIRYLRLFGNIRDISLSPTGELWVIDGDNRLSKILPVSDTGAETPFHVYFTGLSHANGYQEIATYQEIGYDQFPIDIHITAPYFVKPENTAYQYRMDPFMKDWSKWSSQYSTITFHNLPPGEYTLYVRARNILGNTSNIRSAQFVIHPPFYRTTWFILLMAMGALLLVGLILWLWTRKLQHDKKVLEQKVVERTLEITRQKEEIESQRDELERQRDQIAHQKKEITDSILYASRIQTAILPPHESITRFFRDYFIIYIPRDIVSGDFYWFREQNGKILVAAADCTGHGVPGAFMSMLGLTALNDIAVNTRIRNAGQVLDDLRNRVITALHQTGREGEAKDGMDISLCVIDQKKKKIHFSGAFNPLLLFRNQELIEIPGDKMPIGIYDRYLKPFTNHVLDYYPGDTIYLFSDGFIDQFGGKKEKKFKSHRFRNLLASIQDQPLNRQMELMEEAFLTWKGTLDQLDDILVIGIRL